MTERRIKLLSAAGLGLMGVLSSCSGNIFTDCADNFGFLAVPVDTTLVVGQQFTARLRLTTCGGRREVNDTLTWSAQDATVVRVEKETGVTTARAAGRTRLMAMSAIRGTLPAGYVTVR